MTTDDKHTTDPTPDLLPPARLDEIRAQINLSHPVNDTGPNADARDLMRHIDALRAPAPDDGGEALGHRLYSILYPHVERTSPEGWRAMMGDGRERYVEAALALDAHGYARGLAAGRSEGEAERLLCQAATEHVRDREELITRLREQVADASATITSLTAELEAERALTTELREMEAEALASADRWRAASERHEREAAEARRDRGVPDDLPIARDERDAALAELATARALIDNERRLATDAIAAARLDGAQKEREALIADAAARGFHATANFIRIRTRTEGRQG